MATVGCYHLSLIKRHICFKAQWLLWSLKMLICCVLSSFKSFDSVPTNVGKCCASPFLASCFIGCRCRVVVVIVDVVATSHPRWPDLRRFKALSDIGIWFYRSVRAPSFFVLVNCTIDRDRTSSIWLFNKQNLHIVYLYFSVVVV